MSEGRVERKLAAVLAADVVGYSRLMAADEEGTLSVLTTIRRNLIDPKIAEYRGRIVKTTGDGLLVEFHSVVDALRCAVEMQREMAGRNEKVAALRRVEFRIGIHQGDIICQDGDIFGDGVNVAARLEALAKPGGISISERVQEDTKGRLDVEFIDLGQQMLKNIPRPIRIFHVNLAAGSPATVHVGLANKESIASRATRSGRSLVLCTLLALPAAIVIYMLVAKTLGIFLGHLELLGIWIAATAGLWLTQRPISSRRDNSYRAHAPSKAAESAGKSTR